MHEPAPGIAPLGAVAWGGGDRGPLRLTDRVRGRWFGSEPVAEEPLPGLKLALGQFQAAWAASDVSLREAAGHRLRFTQDPDNLAHLRGLASEYLAGLPTPPGDAIADSDAALRVVLMGRTQAGKSTLQEALSGGDGARRGDGRQRYSRDVSARPVKHLAGVEIVDTPGVGALDGAEDFATAFAEVPTADVIVWVASNNSMQEETARALRILGLYGKPVIVVLNCRWDLDHRIKRLDFLETPQVAFRDTDGHLNAIRRHLARAGAQPVTVLSVHANAAFHATQAGPDDAMLHANSRIDTLFSVLTVERDERAAQRRALRLTDQVRTPAIEYLAALSVATQQLHQAITTTQGVNRDMRQRLDREIDRHDDLLAAELHALVERRRTWHTTVDAGNDIGAKWKAEMATMQEEVDAAVSRNQKRLARSLQEATTKVITDWEALPLSAFDLGDFSGFGSVWANRAGRAALGVGGGLAGAAAGAVVGAKIGAILGVAGGPPLMALTALSMAVVGAAAGLLIRPLQDLFGRVVHGRAEVIRRRQHELKMQIHPVLDQVEVSTRDWSTQNTARQREAMHAVFYRIDETLAGQDQVRQQWLRSGQDLQRFLDQLDASTAAALLTFASRPRLAGSIVRAVRAPGVALAVEFLPAAFEEAALFPPHGVCEPILACGPAKPHAAAGQSLPLLNGLWHGRSTVQTLADRSARIALHDASLPSGITKTWADLLGQFTDSHIQITTEADDPHRGPRAEDDA